jgi:hypothetical protein
MKSGLERMRATRVALLSHAPTAVDRIPKPFTLARKLRLKLHNYPLYKTHVMS